jgi:hypothetical protein
MERAIPLVTNGWRSDGRTSEALGRNMTASETRKSTAEQKLDIARQVYRALAAQDADRVITLCDIQGKLIARHHLRPEKDDPKIAS